MIQDITKQFIESFNHFKQNDLAEQQPKQNSIKIPIQCELYNKYTQDIHSNLLRILTGMQKSKDNYFSNAAYSYDAFSDQHRNQFDDEIKTSLVGVNQKINELKENIDRSGYPNNTSKEHIKSVILCLYQFFKSIQVQFQKFVQFNQRKKQKILNTLSTKRIASTNSKVTFDRKISSIDAELEEEAQMIYLEKVSEQQKLQQTRKTLENISELLGHMSNKVLEQQLLTSSFVEIGETGLCFIEKGNKNLIKANDLSKEGGKYWTIYFLGLAFSLLILDFIKS